MGQIFVFSYSRVEEKEDGQTVRGETWREPGREAENNERKARAREEGGSGLRIFLPLASLDCCAAFLKRRTRCSRSGTRKNPGVSRLSLRIGPRRTPQYAVLLLRVDLLLAYQPLKSYPLVYVPAAASTLSHGTLSSTRVVSTCLCMRP